MIELQMSRVKCFEVNVENNSVFVSLMPAYMWAEGTRGDSRFDSILDACKAIESSHRIHTDKYQIDMLIQDLESLSCDDLLDFAISARRDALEIMSDADLDELYRQTFNTGG